MRIWKRAFSPCKLLPEGFAKSTGGMLIIAVCSQHTESLQKIRGQKLPLVAPEASRHYCKAAWDRAEQGEHGPQPWHLREPPRLRGGPRRLLFFFFLDYLFI